MQQTLGVIFGNREFFPDVLISEARRDLENLFKEMNLNSVVLTEKDTKLGSVETWEDAKKCAALFDAHRHEIEGILVVLPNFGDERGVADAVKLSGLQVPILVQAYPDDLKRLDVAHRRDAFCGKISVCNNLRQYGYPFSLTELHTVPLLDESFKKDLKKFLGVCRVVNGMRKARFGAIGARPGAFNTVRYSEKLLQDAGMSVITIDFSEVIGNAQALADNEPRVQEKIKQISAYAETSSVPAQALLLMAKLAVVIDEWMAENDIVATALQCWTSIQKNYGINVCALMSLMSQNLKPSACEVDITGVAAMYALQLASGKPSALVDWNNNYGNDENKCVFFHCGNWAKEFLPDIQIKSAEILGTIIGEEKTYGAVAGRTPAGPVTFARITTDDVYGEIRAYVGEGNFTNDPLETFGARAVIQVPNLQALMHYICQNGFEHHAAMTPSFVADIIEEAFSTYMQWDVYRHQ
ncbi:MAG: L-fucose/L-arabinose isomerase family protein [candidate division KSB1 bacterium]|nr:L-fucose/L-arabinose isomerase family protein [candidate division KSB1 bacterium]MDZ7346951.1 L-fucose/L-arabinose isomerase family protein [candidate division KSB1 bacterium]